MYRIEIAGIPPTLNTWLSGTHWRTKAAQKVEWEELFAWAFVQAKLPKKLQTPITLNVTQFCKGKVRDVDNTVLAAKFCADALKSSGRIPDDSPEYVKTLILTSEKGKENKTVVIIS